MPEPKRERAKIGPLQALAIIGLGGIGVVGTFWISNKLGIDITKLGEQPTYEPGTQIPSATPSFLPTMDNTLTQIPSLTPIPATPTPEISVAELVKKEWPDTAKKFLSMVSLKENDVLDDGIKEYIQNLRDAGVNVVELSENDIQKELNPDDSWTGGWLIDPRRDPNKPPYFLNTVYLAKNPFRNMQYGFMNPDVFRNRLGFTPQEIEKLGYAWKDNNQDGVSDFVGSGIPANYAGLIEGAVFYPLYSLQDGAVHELYRVLGPEAQTIEQRFAMNINNPGGA